MFNSKSLASLLVAALASRAASATLQKRADAPTDVQILNYALTLEYLESAFYTGALSKFDAKTFSDAGMNRSLFEEIASHESDHVTFLSTALGDQATKACNYSFPYSDVKGFASLSMVLEGVGVSAYLGAAASIVNKDYLTAAGSILTTEARHSAYVSSVPANSQAPWSKAFDIPLNFNEVYSLAAPFITSCPSTNPTLPVKSFPALNVTSTSYTGGSNLTIAFAANNTDNATQLYMAFLTGLSAIYAPYDAASKSVVIPANLTGAGTVYAVLTSANSTNGTVPTDDSTLAGPAVLLFPNNATGAPSIGGASTATTGAKKSGALAGNGAIALGWTAVLAVVSVLVAAIL